MLLSHNVSATLSPSKILSFITELIWQIKQYYNFSSQALPYIISKNIENISQVKSMEYLTLPKSYVHVYHFIIHF